MNDDICNLLPQGIVTQVCLKRKWKIKSYVYSEAVRPNFMQGTRNFLKLNNLFSAAIDINICMK